MTERLVFHVVLERALERLEPKPDDHPTIGDRCPACGKPFREGDYTTLVPLGPGDDPENQRKARENQAYNAVAVEAHWKCATGWEP